MNEGTDERWTLAFHKSTWLLALGNIFMLWEDVLSYVCGDSGE